MWGTGVVQGPSGDSNILCEGETAIAQGEGGEHALRLRSLFDFSHTTRSSW